MPRTTVVEDTFACSSRQWAVPWDISYCHPRANCANDASTVVALAVAIVAAVVAAVDFVPEIKRIPGFNLKMHLVAFE